MRWAVAKVLLGAFCLGAVSLGGAPRAICEGTTTGNLFEFHSGFWNNLHHFLYREAQLSEPQKGPHNLSLTTADTAELEQLSPQERDAWNQALAYYAKFVVKRDLLFDEELFQIKNQLQDGEDSPDLATATIPAELKAALVLAAPVYRKHWWPRHDAQNKEWIAQLEPLVKRYGANISAQLQRICGEPWPQHPVRVDAVAYANWAGAYTTIRPTRPTISTSDPANQDIAALEIVFHETSHGMMDKVMETIHSAESRPGGRSNSGSIWHAVLFYTAGELVAQQVAGYTPYADKNGLWLRAWPSPDRSLIEQDWNPHMDGSVSLRQALTKLVADLASTPPPH